MGYQDEEFQRFDVPKSERGERELTDVLDRIIEYADHGTVVFDTWMDVGRPWELLEANERVLPGGPVGSAAPDGGGVKTVERQDASHETTADHSPGIHQDAVLRGNVVIENDVSIDSGVVIEGPVRVRSGSSIGPNAYIRGATLIGENAHIGHAVEIKNSVVMADTHIGHLSYGGDSVLAPRVNLGAGTNVANLRHDDDPVVVTVKDDRVSTGRRKFGTVIGPDVKTGIQTGINAGVTLSADARTEPGEIVLRDR
jgi:bifunctional UDP-N-acetylglucosamine pyrophosphorylase/glucosamine-1-phosphate N-acetyltransferase